MKYSRISLLLLLATALLGVSPAALRAQTGSGSSARGGGETQPRRLDPAQVEALIEQLRRQVDGLERRRLAAERSRSRSDATADSALRALAPQIERASRVLAYLEASRSLQSADATRRYLRAPGAASLAQGAIETQPAGWMGVSYSGSRKIEHSDKGLFIFHYDYPVVESVEPASPAERAGLMAGDTIIAYDGKDVRRRTISLDKQLRPGARVRVRVRRNGETLDVPVAIERRPATFRTFVQVAPDAPTPPDPGLLRERVRPRIAPVAPALPMEPELPPVPPSTAPSVTTVFTGGGSPAVAGAEVARLNPDLRELFGVPAGVLVLSVAPGSPAAASGLRAGDVILRVNDQAVASPQALGRAVRECSTRSARLDLVRKKKGKELVLKW